MTVYKLAVHYRRDVSEIRRDVRHTKFRSVEMRQDANQMILRTRNGIPIEEDCVAYFAASFMHFQELLYF